MVARWIARTCSWILLGCQLWSHYLHYFRQSVFQNQCTRIEHCTVSPSIAFAFVNFIGCMTRNRLYLETVSRAVVQYWWEKKLNTETFVPRVITDPEPKFMPLDNSSCRDHVAICQQESWLGSIEPDWNSTDLRNKVNLQFRLAITMVTQWLIQISAACYRFCVYRYFVTFERFYCASSCEYGLPYLKSISNVHITKATVPILQH